MIDCKGGGRVEIQATRSRYFSIKMKEDPSLRKMDEEDEDKIILQLFDVNGIKIQNVLLKSGQISPVYIDLRVLVSFPELLVSMLQKLRISTRF